MGLLTKHAYTRFFTRDMLAVHEHLFDASMDAILSRYPDVDTFLLEAHGVTEERRRHWINLYVEEK